MQHLLLQNAPTQSLLSVVNGILDESVERKNSEIPHVRVLKHVFKSSLLN